MTTLYILCATVGGTILIIQTILLVVGAGGHGDLDDIGGHDLHDGHLDPGGGAGDSDAGFHGDGFFQILSFKALVAFVTFFGLAGLATTKSGFEPIPALVLALCAGGLALYSVAYLMAAISRLQSKGNLDVRNAVGRSAKVYLRVPGGRSGQGKVLIAMQGRRVELKAITPGPEIPSGAEVRVVGTSAAGTVEVLPAERSA
ncbi:MAG TPA: hypothetical protein VMT52_10035 [Planctomycetota bacterium]|nr:hypothetical protein [Planctomycetota bacterium]